MSIEKIELSELETFNNKIIDIYDSSENINSLINLIAQRFNITYLLITWNIDNKIWYIPVILFDNCINQNENLGWYLNETPNYHNLPYYNMVQNINKFSINIKSTTLIDKKCYIFYNTKDDEYSLQKYTSENYIFTLILTKIIYDDYIKRQNNRQEIYINHISHSIKTPLNNILNTLKLLNIDSDIHQTNFIENINNIDKSANTLTNNLIDIIDIVKLELNIMQIKLESFNLYQLIREIINLFENKKNITLNYFIENNVPENIISDKKKIKQVIINLLNNSFLYTVNGEINIYISSIAVDESENHNFTNLDNYNFTNLDNHNFTNLDKYEISIIVKDTGIGMDDKTENNLFKPVEFFVKNYQKGFSMRISYLLAKLLNGNLKLLYTKKDKGTCFQFDIIAGSAISEDKNNILNYQTIKFDKLNILIVEDDDIGRVVLEKLLKQKKYNTVDSVVNGYEAYKLISNNITKYNIIITDIQMPKLDGIQLSKKISNLYSSLNKPIPYIFGMTARILKLEDSKIFNDMISKPLNINKIYDKLNKLHI